MYGREPSRTLNAKECVSRGCALQAAMLSPVFKVRPALERCLARGVGRVFREGEQGRMEQGAAVRGGVQAAPRVGAQKEFRSPEKSRGAV